MLAVSGFLLSQSAATVLEVREISVPLVSDIPQFERRISLLTDQIELAQLHAATRTGSAEERMNVFVIPDEVDLDRLVGVFDVVGSILREQGLLARMSDITLGDPTPSSEEGLEERLLTVQLAAHEDGVQTVLSLIKFAGLLTVGDLLSSGERKLLLQKTEEENPTGVIAMEQFLSTDLLSYARDPDAFEEQLLRAFTSPSFLKTLQDMLQSSAVRDARKILGGNIGNSLQKSALWPLPLMTLHEARIRAGSASGWFVLSLQITLYNRAHVL